MLSPLKSRRVVYRVIVFVFDLVCVVAAMQAAYTVRFEWSLAWLSFDKPAMPRELYIPLQLASVVMWISVFVVNGFYRRISLPFADEVLRLAKGVFWGWVLVVAAGFLYRGTDYSRVVAVLTGVFLFIFLLAGRRTARFLYRQGILRWVGKRRVLVLGQGRLAASIKKVLAGHKEFELESRPVPPISDFKNILERGAFHEVYLGEPSLSHMEVVALSDAGEEAGVPFHIVPDLLELRMGELILDESLGLPTFQLKSVSLHGWTYFYKRVFDVGFSLLLLTAGFLPLAILAMMIKLDSPGLVFFRQERVGLKGRVFGLFKFRSMQVGAEDRLKDLQSLNERPGPMFKMARDPRVTRVGRWIRRWSVDEVPQLLNVLLGQMSLVGPRPQLPREAESNSSRARKRLNVLPGITGLWQVSGRARLSYEEMIELDIYYIEQWSPGLDLKILFKTIPAVLGRHGAY